MIPYGHQDINQADIDAVVSVLQSDYLTQGPVLPQFEQAVANYCHAKHAMAVTNATSALHLACLALDVGTGDIVWTTPITFVASANCARYCGADVDFVDINPQTYNMDVHALENKLRHAKQQGKLPKVVIPVHLCGQSCDMKTIHRLSQEYGFNVIEDASHAIGAQYDDKPVGGCQYSDMVVFSFHPVKIITTAEGGMILTQKDDLAQRVQLLRAHGITRDENLMTHTADGAWYYQQIDLGFNYRMTELQGALGLSQMQRLDEFVAKRRNIIQRYHEALADLPVTLPYQDPLANSSWHLYVIRLQLDKCKLSRKETFDALRAAGVGVNVHYIPVYKQPYYQQLGFVESDYPNAEQYYQECITLPVYAGLTDKDQQYIIDTLHRLLG